jgi:hypothetical protein
LWSIQAGCSGKSIDLIKVNLKSRVEAKVDLGVGARSAGRSGARVKMEIGVDGPFSTFKASIPILSFPF